MKFTSLKSVSIGLLCFSLLAGACQKDSGNTKTTQTITVPVVSYNFTVTSWKPDTYLWYVDFAIPELTQHSINSSLVQVYFATSFGTWQALPMIAVAPTNYHMGYLYSTGNVEVTWEYDNPSGNGDIGIDPNSYYRTTCKYKIVVIPLEAMKANPGVNVNDYVQVKELLKLQD